MILPPDQNSKFQLTLKLFRFLQSNTIQLGQTLPEKEVIFLFEHLATGIPPKLNIRLSGRFPLAPTLPSFTCLYLWAPAQSPLESLAVRQPLCSRMMIYFQIHTGFVNTMINEERHKSYIPSAGPLKRKQTAFQHHLA